jgi:hypothetical protein
MLDRIHSTIVALFAALVIAIGAPASNALGQELDPGELLSTMSAEVAGLERFILSGEAYTDARLGAGQIIQNSSQVTMYVSKPDAMHLVRRDAEDTKDLYFSDGLVSIYTESVNLYAQAEVPEGLGAAVDFAINEIGIDAPLLDFVSHDMSENLLADAQELRHLGKSLVRGKLYEQVTIRNSEVDIQVWIAAEGRPLPGKLLISSKWEGGSPRFIVHMDWDIDPEFPDDVFNFDPPEGATEVPFVTTP